MAYVAGKVELVKEIIVNLATAVGVGPKTEDYVWHPLPVERFLEHDLESRASRIVASKQQYDMLFSNNNHQSSGLVPSTVMILLWC